MLCATTVDSSSLIGSIRCKKYVSFVILPFAARLHSLNNDDCVAQRVTDKNLFVSLIPGTSNQLLSIVLCIDVNIHHTHRRNAAKARARRRRLEARHGPPAGQFEPSVSMKTNHVELRSKNKNKTSTIHTKVNHGSAAAQRALRRVNDSGGIKLASNSDARAFLVCLSSVFSSSRVKNRNELCSMCACCFATATDTQYRAVHGSACASTKRAPRPACAPVSRPPRDVWVVAQSTVES
jgi:hypothetical protein